MTSRSGREPHLIDEMVRRIVKVADPERVILFGSRARGETSRESDYDLLVIGESALPRWQRTPPLYQALGGLGVAKDIIWWTPGEVAEWRGVSSHMITRATREGRVLYERPA